MTGPETPTTILEPREPSHFPTYGTVVTGLVLVVLGLVWLLDAADIMSVKLSMVIPIALAVVGLALMVGGAALAAHWFNRFP